MLCNNMAWWVCPFELCRVFAVNLAGMYLRTYLAHHELESDLMIIIIIGRQQLAQVAFH